MNGGYLMISKNDSDIYAKAQKALVLGKPILFYENATTCYYIDTISGGEITTEIVDDEEVTSYGDIILTKGGKTITITSANAVSESGSIIANRIEDIVDSAGNKRFIEFDLSMETFTGVAFKYNRASLSGTHLMIVIAGEIEDTTVIAHNSTFAEINLPKWIIDKIMPIYSIVVDYKTFIAYADDGNTTQNLVIRLSKPDSSTLRIYNIGAFTATADRNFRIQFDLLIDSDYSE